MPLKKFYEFNSNESCNFCDLNKIDVLYGPVYKNKQKYDGRGISVHYFCLLMASKIEQKGRDSQGILGFFPKDIIKELSRGKSQVCCYCGKRGATVHCIHTGCNKIFHLPCGIENGSIHQFFLLFSSFCHLHKPKQSIPASIVKTVEASCIICCDNINKYNKYHSLWPSCCKPRAFLHRKCVQTLADNAGYYFKCPFCNNSGLFKSEMQKIGIYVPEQEASWESEPHAYEELLVRGSGCESKNCCCPQGRKLNKANSSWQLELCKVCGGNGVHLGCTPRWKRGQGYQFNWFCEICKPVYLENNPSKTPERPVEEDNTTLLPNVDENTSTLMDEDSDLTSDTISIEERKFEEDDIENTKPLIETENILLKMTPGTSLTTPIESNNSLPNAVCKKDVPVVLEDVLIPKPTVQQESAHDSSDDDCQIVGVTSMPRKRSANEFIPAMKRFRTARWIPPTNSNERRVEHHAGNSHPNILLDENLALRINANRLLQSQTQAQTATEKLTLPIRTESDRSKQSVPPCGEAKNSVSNHQGTSRFSDVKLKLSEVSINLLPVKEVVPVANASTISECISIELSSDEEPCNDTPKTISKKSNPVMSLPTQNKPPSQLQQLLTQQNAPDSPFRAGAGINLNAWIKSKLEESEKFNSSNKNYFFECPPNSVKQKVSAVTVQVILSSDDEEEETNSSPLVNTSPVSKQQGSISREPQSSCHNINNPNLANLLKDISHIQKKLSQNYSPHKNVGNESSSLSTGPVKSVEQTNKSPNKSSFSILNSPLNVEDKVIKPEVLIVSDDSEDDITVSTDVGGNNLPGNLIEESIDTVNHAPEHDNAFLENPIKDLPEIPPEQSSTSWVGIISEVTTLTSDQFDMKDGNNSPEENDTIIEETAFPIDACELFSDQVVSSTVTSSDFNHESKLPSPTVSLCACVVSCSCKNDSSFKESGNLVAGRSLISVEESVSSTTNDDNHNNDTSS